jgi:hypothetical protein
VHRCRSVTRRLLAALAIAAAAAAVISGCSPGADYPSIFPAVHDMPPPRADMPLDPIQVQQATEDLISARNHLNAAAPGASQAKTPAADPNATAARKKQPPANTPSAVAGGTQAAATGTPPTSAGSSQTAGADTKP